MSAKQIKVKKGDWFAHIVPGATPVAIYQATVDDTYPEFYEVHPECKLTFFHPPKVRKPKRRIDVGKSTVTISYLLPVKTQVYRGMHDADEIHTASVEFVGKQWQHTSRSGCYTSLEKATDWIDESGKNGMFHIGNGLSIPRERVVSVKTETVELWEDSTR